MPKVKSTPKGRTRRMYKAHPYKKGPKSPNRIEVEEDERQHYIAMLPDYENVANTPRSKKMRELKKRNSVKTRKSNANARK